MIILYIQRLPAALHHHGRYNDTAGNTHHVCPPAHGVHPGDDDDDGHDDGVHSGDDDDGDDDDGGIDDGVEIDLMEISIESKFF